jgi:hypothetical protein
MDSRLFYTVFRHALASVVWDKHGENEYVLVGDGSSLDHSRLQELAQATFSEPLVLYPESRSETLEVPVERLAAFVAGRLRPMATVTVSDAGAQVFLQVHGMGVARTGRSQANNSSKPTPLRGAA